MRLAVIPARGGSKRIPRKNIKPFCGKPMIAYSIIAAQKSGLFDYIIVSTDDEEIAAVAQQYGAEVPFLRPAELANDFTTVLEVMQHAILKMQLSGIGMEYVACIYATAPMLHANDLLQGYSLLASRPEKSFSLAVTSFPFPVQRAVRIESGGGIDAIYPEYRNTRSQDLEPAYHDAGQFCWGRVEAWLQGIAIFSPNTLPVLLPRERVQDIDTPEDWNRAELMYRLQNDTSGGDDLHGQTLRYLCVPRPEISLGNHTIRAIQPDEIENIRLWRNAQISVLRQDKLLEQAEQVAYYRTHVWPEMQQLHPLKVLVSILHNGRHIGYGGLVHISWPHLRAEVSFLLDHHLAADPVAYADHFLVFLRLIKKLAFDDLRLNRLYTETWAFREAHLAVLEQAGFEREGVCREHVYINGQWVDAVFHGILRHDKE